MKASVTHFREGKDNSTGEVVTMYILTVEPAGAPVYSISKRYSDFANIYTAFKESLPPDYKFPNKSMFHNNSQYTKERRVRGFQELLRLLVKYHPNSEKVKDFLRYREKSAESVATPSNTFYRGSKDLPQQPRMSVSRVPKDPTGTYEAVLRRKLDSLSSFLRLKQAHYDSFHFEKCDESQVHREETTKACRKAFGISAGVYGMITAVNVVDVSQESYSHMLLTVFALGMLLAFLSIIDRKKSAS